MDRAEWDHRYADRELLWTAEPNRWVVRELAELPAGRALDLAAGEGRNAIWLAARGWRVTAVDFSAVALGKARQLAGAQPGQVQQRLHWVHEDVLGYHPEPAAFDLVLVSYLHLLAAARRELLHRAAGALAPGGTLLVIGHDVANLTDGVGGPQDARVLFTAADVLADLGDRPELSVRRAERVRRPVQTEDGERDALDAVVRLCRAEPRRDEPSRDEPSREQRPPAAGYVRGRPEEG